MNATRVILVLAMLLCLGVGTAMATAGYPGLVYVGTPDTWGIAAGSPDWPVLGQSDAQTPNDGDGDSGGDTGEGETQPSDS